MASIPFKLPRVSRYPSRKAWEEACWTMLSTKFPTFLITAYERRNVILRAVVMDRLSDGLSYREIAKELFLSQQTISSIKKNIGENYRSYRERGKLDRKRRVYSSGRLLPKKKKLRGRPMRTKYGTLYVP